MIPEKVSIHAPAWGATQRARFHAPIGRCFNPRARVGRDRAEAEKDDDSESFNPRARVGRDAERRAGPHEFWRFQSTRPRGARRRQRSTGFFR